MQTWLRLRVPLVLCMLLSGWPLQSAAELLNRIEVYKESDIGVIHIILTRPVIYTHHFPPEHSYLVHIYFNDMTLDFGSRSSTPHGAARPDDEFMRSPPNDIVPVFWVAYNNHGTNDFNLDPFHLLVQFGQPVHYKITPDENSQGFYIFVLSTDTPSSPAKSKLAPPTSPATNNAPAANPASDQPAGDVTETENPTVQDPESPRTPLP